MLTNNISSFDHFSLQTNFVNYYSKGMADFMGIWDSDEFFIPKGENKNLVDVIEKAYPERGGIIDRDLALSYEHALNTEWKGGRGWADRHGHPPCFLQIL